MGFYDLVARKKCESREWIEEHVAGTESAMFFDRCVIKLLGHELYVYSRTQEMRPCPVSRFEASELKKNTKVEIRKIQWQIRR